MTLQQVYEKQKKEYEKKYGKNSWQWKDEGSVFAIMDYLSSCEMTEDDWKFAKEIKELETCIELTNQEINDE